MASIWKRPWQRDNPDSPWLITLTTGGKRRTITGSANHKATQAIARKLEQDESLRRRGLLDPGVEAMAVHAVRPIQEHIDDYEQHLRDKNSSERHIESSVTYLDEIIESLDWQTIRNIAAEPLQRRLAEQRRANGTGARTTNARIIAWKGFARWLVRHGRLAADPLAPLSRMRQDDDRRLVRRILTDVEFERLLATMKQGPMRYGMTGPDRATLYTVLAATGFRRSEVASLRAADFRLDAEGGPVVVVRAAYAKNRREVAQPLPAALAAPLRAWLALQDPNAERLWPLPDKPRRRVLVPDLVAAGIDPHDPSGTVDFHSFRHGFVSRVVRSGVSIKAAQTLARHSDPKLTLNIYTHLSLADERAALERAFAPRPAAAARATGTHG
ncbi:MAG: tyrosine recombinase XerC [Phycisphaerales bacterium]